jgi:hypothetical protein
MQKRTRVKKRSGRSTAKAMTVPRWTPGLPGDSTETGDAAEDEGPVVGILEFISGMKREENHYK